MEGKSGKDLEFSQNRIDFWVAGREHFGGLCIEGGTASPELRWGAEKV